MTSRMDDPDKLRARLVEWYHNRSEDNASAPTAAEAAAAMGAPALLICNVWGGEWLAYLSGDGLTAETTFLEMDGE